MLTRILPLCSTHYTLQKRLNIIQEYVKYGQTQKRQTWDENYTTYHREKINSKIENSNCTVRRSGDEI